MDKDTLRRVPLFSNLDHDQLDEIISKGVIKTYKKYEMVHFCEEPEAKFFVVLSG